MWHGLSVYLPEHRRRINRLITLIAHHLHSFLHPICIETSTIMPTKNTANGVENTNGTAGFAPEGSLTSFKNLYQGPPDKNRKWSWTEKEPEDVADPAENEETAQHALITRLQKATDSRKKYDMHSIIIQSPWLKDALAEILKDYPGIHCGLKRLEFAAPFTPFVHRWSQLLEYRSRKDLDATTAKHVELLYGVLCAELKDVIKTLEDYVSHGIITFDHIWTMYQPGALIYSNSHKGAYGVYTLKSGSYGNTPCGRFYQLNVEAIDWNGTSFGRSSQTIRLGEFHGTARILGLSAFPLSFHPYEAKVKEALVSRGKKFEALAGSHYMAYEGFAVTSDRDGNEASYMCTGRIIVDSDSYQRFSSRSVGRIEPLSAKEYAKEPEGTPERLEIQDPTEMKYVFGSQEKEERPRLTEHHHLLCLPRVRGYSLKKKKWLLFYVELIQVIKFNENAFASLVLPKDQKELILAFAESQAMNQTGFDDVISGKGRGHITLLSGPPGVGKTLTAESVAEHMRAPLFMMSAGDLGIDPDQVETKLTNILEMISKWNAVLLLDECDVFLEARSTHDLERNKLVSIFLRVLEYYEGLLFLTTNRVDNIDAAFQSRIHISLAYPNLTSASRKSIWQNFLKSSGGLHEWKDDDLEDLASVELNGRQIKNVLKSASLLAARKKDGLNKKYVDMVLGIEKKRPGVAAGF